MKAHWDTAALLRAAAAELRDTAEAEGEGRSEADGLVPRVLAALREKAALLVLDLGRSSLADDEEFGRVLHALLSRTLQLRLLLVSPAPLPPSLASLPAKVTTIALQPLSPLDAARLLARRVGRPLHELLPPSTPPPLATLESLAADPLLAALGGHPGRLTAAAAAVCDLLARRSAREALQLVAERVRGAAARQA